jgi:hypothetical protein
MTASGFTALARFHLHVGARLAIRAAAPLAGLPFVAVLLQQDPSGALRALAAWLLGPSGGVSAGLALAALSLALASWAAPRVTTGLGAWPRHLPVTHTVHRRAALVALATAQTPVLAGLLLLAPAAAHQAGGIVPGRLAALPVSVAAAALASWPGTHAARSRPLAWAALLLAATADLALVPLALVLVLAAERAAGPLAAHGAASRRRSSTLPLPLLLATRALGLAALGAVVASLAPVAAITFLRLNNELSPAVAAGAARLGAGIGVVVLLTALTERLAIRRPVWPWSRSLPAGAVRHVAEDALLLALPCLVPLAATAWLDPLAALAVAACLPSLALLAAGALRRSGPGQTGVAAGPPLGGALLAAWVAVLPGLALLALAAAPLAWRAAAARDRRQKVSRWDELHHRAVGDPLSWSAR